MVPISRTHQWKNMEYRLIFKNILILYQKL